MSGRPCAGGADLSLNALVRVSAAGGVPGSAVLFFQLELVELQKGVPEGFMFVWLGDAPELLFPAMDLDGDHQVPLDEVAQKKDHGQHASSTNDALSASSSQPSSSSK